MDTWRASVAAAACDERLSLEAFQPGPSWITILRRSPGFRAAFADFRIEKLSGADQG